MSLLTRISCKHETQNLRVQTRFWYQLRLDAMKTRYLNASERVSSKERVFRRFKIACRSVPYWKRGWTRLSNAARCVSCKNCVSTRSVTTCQTHLNAILFKTRLNVDAKNFWNAFRRVSFSKCIYTRMEQIYRMHLNAYLVQTAFTCEPHYMF